MIKSLSKLLVAFADAAISLCSSHSIATACFVMLAISNSLFSVKANATNIASNQSDHVIDGELIEVEFSDEATYDCEPDSNQCTQSGNWHFSVNVGLGLRTNPLNDSNNIPLIFIPNWSYYGEQFFIENLDIGYTLFENKKNQFNLIATPSYDSVFFNRWDPGNFFIDIGIANGLQSTPDSQDNLTEINPDEISSRQFSYLGGFEWNKQFEKSTLQVSLLSDLTNRHKGSEVRAAYQYKSNDYFSSTFGFTWKDNKLTDYYYGVDADEVVDDRGAYQASASFNPFIRLSINTSKDPDSWRISLEYQKLSGQISSSPIADDNYVVTFFAGKRFSWN